MTNRIYDIGDPRCWLGGETIHTPGDHNAASLSQFRQRRPQLQEPIFGRIPHDERAGSSSKPVPICSMETQPSVTAISLTLGGFIFETCRFRLFRRMLLMSTNRSWFAAYQCRLQSGSAANNEQRSVLLSIRFRCRSVTFLLVPKWWGLTSGVDLPPLKSCASVCPLGNVREPNEETIGRKRKRPSKSGGGESE